MFRALLRTLLPGGSAASAVSHSICRWSLAVGARRHQSSVTAGALNHTFWSSATNPRRGGSKDVDWNDRRNRRKAKRPVHQKIDPRFRRAAEADARKRVSVAAGESNAPHASDSQLELMPVSIAGESGAESESYHGLTHFSWYPGHMHRTMKELERRIKHTQLVIEVRDARIPFSSANSELSALIGRKRRIVVFNKIDLAHPNTIDAVTRYYEQLSTVPPHVLQRQASDVAAAAIAKAEAAAETAAINSKRANRTDSAVAAATTAAAASAVAASVPVLPEAILFVDAHDTPTNNPAIWLRKRLLPLIIENTKRRLHVPNDSSNSTNTDTATAAFARKYKTVPSAVLVVGYPNVGKSSIINALKQYAAASAAAAAENGASDASGLPHVSPTAAASGTGGRSKVGPLPGVTRHVSGFLVHHSPPILVLDSPGIMMPRFKPGKIGVQTALKLALTGAVRDSLIGETTLCSYLLELMNAYNPRAYMSAYRIPNRITDVNTLLYYVAARLESLPKPKRLITAAAGSSPVAAGGSDSDAVAESDLTLTVAQRERAAAFLIAAYRSGELGRYTFDDIPALPTDTATNSVAAAAPAVATSSAAKPAKPVPAAAATPAVAIAAPGIAAGVNPSAVRGKLERRERQARSSDPKSFASKIRHTNLPATSFARQ